PPTQTLTLSLHDALPIFAQRARPELHASGAPRDHAVGHEERGDLLLDPLVLADAMLAPDVAAAQRRLDLLGRQVGTEIRGSERRSEEHTSELQSRSDLVC